MAEKKTEKKATAPKKVAVKVTSPKKVVAAKNVELAINAESVGFRAGDVYNALASANMPLTVAEIAKKAKISEDETLLGMGWLFKEGKIKDDGQKIILA